MHVASQRLVVHTRMPFRLAVVSHVDHVARFELSLDRLSLGYELERLTLAKETMEEHDVLLLLRFFLDILSSNNVNVQFCDMLFYT